MVNGLGAVRMGDIIKPHSCFNCGGKCDSVCAPHNGVYLGSRAVLVNGRPIQVMGDITSCTSIALGCSPNVMAN